MLLNEYQKSIVRRIQNGTIRTFVDYLLIEFQTIENLKTNFPLLKQRGLIINNRRYDFEVRGAYLGLDTPAYVNRLSDSIGLFIGLLTTLEKEGLIVISIGDDSHFPAVTTKCPSGLYEYDGS